MNRVSLLREQLKQAEQFVFMTVGDVTPEEAHWTPPGIANPLGATLAHLVLGEDAFVQGMFKGTTPLAAGSWAGKVGISEPPPPPFPPKSWYDWGRKVQVDLAALQEFGKAVFAATDEYVAGLKDDDLDRSIDLSGVGFGNQTTAWVISNGVLGHRLAHWGEISCLKGLQGSKGFPV